MDTRRDGNPEQVGGQLFAAATQRNGRGVRLSQPLLLVALGGTGRKIATQLKAAFIERFGQVPQNALLIAFDSAEDPVSVREGRHGRVISLERESEFFLLERVPLAGIKRALSRHPEIAGRLGADLDRIHRTSIQDGTAQERPQGLLALIWNAPRVARVLANAVRRLVERQEDLRDELAAGVGINVVLTGSTCGGQNSGAMLDMAYLVREALMALGDLGESSRMIAMVVLPGAFPEVRGANLQPNTNAFFLDLDALMQGRGFHARYPGNLEVESRERPFDTVFVLDGVDEQGRARANLDEVCSLAAQALALLLGTEVGMCEFFGAVNPQGVFGSGQGVLHGVSAAGFGTYLATVGQAVIRFPAGQIARRCTCRLAQALADACLQAPPGGAAPPAFPGTRTLRDRLRLHAGSQGAFGAGVPFETQIAAPASLLQAGPEEQPALARALVANFQQRRIFDAAFGQIKETAGRAAAELSEELRSGLAAALAGGRLPAVTAWLRGAQEVLQGEYAALTAEVERLAAAAEGSQKALERAAAAMDQAAEGLFFLRKVQVRGAVSRYLEEASTLAHLRVEQRVAEVAAELVHTGLRELRGWAQQAADAGARLGQARARLAGQEAELARLNGTGSEIVLAEPALVEQLYNRYADDPAALAQQAAGEGRLLAWGQMAADALAGRLAEVAGRAFEPMRGLTVEDVLAQQWDDPAAAAARPDRPGAQQWIGRLADLAAGAWNLDRALLSGGGADQASFLTIGVPDATHSIFANSGYTLVSTHDPERIVALRTVYGASFDTLKPAVSWQRAYEQAVGRTPLHVVERGA